MDTEQSFESLLVAITESVNVRIQQDLEMGFDNVLLLYFEKKLDKKTLALFSPLQKEAVLRMTHAMMILGEYAEELQQEMPDHEVEEWIDELHDYCYASLIEPQEMVLEPVADLVETLFAE
jgi:hypothetical protein